MNTPYRIDSSCASLHYLVSERYTSLDDALEALRLAEGWDDIAHSPMPPYDTVVWCYASQDECDADRDDGAYAPRIVWGACD